MINTIIFDLGDVFIDLGISKSQDAFKKLGLRKFDEDLQEINRQYEIGAISENEFLNGFLKKVPTTTILEVQAAWNLIIGEFPIHRLQFLQYISKDYRIFLLSNTDATHIAHFKQKVGSDFYQQFEQCFEKMYYSFEVGMRKPNTEIFEYVLDQHNLVANNALFIDDKSENILAAAKLGIQTWHLTVGKHDVSEMFIHCKQKF